MAQLEPLLQVAPMDFQHTLWFILAAVEFIAFAMLIIRGLAGHYRWFSLFLISMAMSSILMRVVGKVDALAYAIAWVIVEPTLLALFVASVLELVRKLPERYPRFGSFGRAKLRALLEIAVIMAIVSSVLEAAGPQWKYSIRTWIPVVIVLKRIVTTVVAGYLILVIVFIARFPVPLERNFKVHMRLLTAYATLTSAVMFWQNTANGGRGTAASNIVLLAGSLVVFLFWIWLLKRAGEVAPVRRLAVVEDIRRNARREQELRRIVMRHSSSRRRE